ncbi:retrovirus-related pol polyprotein from transposon TNT 1-94 [Tanacetum coccineum]|uniref:Retrovirus-related pol polyprotein from transposon TNT 1-94 n=1 Tax=Tanacetum coccineum TaxID=301880 RepID=A0ABQ5FGB5_9ASTR
MTGAKFDIKKLDGTGDFGLWRINMHALLIQHRCEATLEVSPADMEAEAKAELNKKAHSVVILCLGNKVLREVTGETTAVGVWSKLEALYMTKLLANKLYLNKKLYTFYMPAGRKIFEHIDEFNKIVFDLAYIEVKFKHDDLVLLLLTLLPASYEHFVDTLLYRLEALTLEDVMAILNSKEIKERSKANGDNGERLYALLDWIMDSGSLYHMTPKLDLFFDFLECDGGSVLLGDKRECKIRGIGKLGTLEKDGYTVKSQSGKVKVGTGLFLRFKHEAFGKFKEWKQLVENQTRRTIKKLRIDNGLEFCNREFKQLCIESGIAKHLTVVGTLQQMGYPKGVKGYRLYRLDNESPKIVTSRNVVFNESAMYKDTLNDSGAGTDKSVKKSQFEVELQGLNNIVRHTSIRVILALTVWKDYELEQLDVKTTFLHGNLEEVIYMRQPAGYEQVNKQGFISKWRRAMKEEMEFYGNSEQEPWEGNKVLQSLVRHTSIRIILALTVCKDYELEQLDVKTAFLHGNVKEMIYMRQPPGYEQDDMLIACKSKAEIGSTKSLLKKEFDMKELGEAKKILGTANVGLVYGTNCGNHVDVTGFVDSEYTKDPDKGGVYGLYEGCEGSYLAKVTLGRVGHRTKQCGS